MSLQEPNDVAISLGKVFVGILLTNDGLCEYKQDKYTLLSDDLAHDRYINHLCDTFHSNINSFFAWMFAWMTDVNLYSNDGWIMENLNRYITNQTQLDEWFNQFALTYDCNFDKLDQTSIDYISSQKEGITLN